jgi:FdhD protein
MPSDKALRSTTIVRINRHGETREADAVAVEEPLEIRVGGRSVAVVMRTPGQDRELAAGFLVTEGLLRLRDAVLDMVYCGRTGESPEENVLDVVLAPSAKVNFERLTRHVFTSSSCGICSKASIEAIRQQFAPIAQPISPTREVLAALPERARVAQPTFSATGGLHASALFDVAGNLLVAREDVGRHNALDKVIGHAFWSETLPLTDRILFVSGRVSFEIMQKALAGGIPCVAAISAPTSAAVEFARESGQTLVGFLRAEGAEANWRMNVYTGQVR